MAETTAGTRLIDRDHVAIQEDIELGGVASVAWPGFGVLGGLDGFDPALAGGGIRLLLLGSAAGGAGLAAMAMGHGVA